MDMKAVPIAVPADANVIIGQAHFIKTAEDLAEIAVGAAPGIAFGLAFSEASGPCLVRSEGNDPELVKAAVAAALAAAAGHTFYLFIRNAYPINLLNAVKDCPEVARVFCATANPLHVLVAQTPAGNGIVGVVDGSSPKGVETDADRTARREMIRKFGYKLS